VGNPDCSEKTCPDCLLVPPVIKGCHEGVNPCGNNLQVVIDVQNSTNFSIQVLEVTNGATATVSGNNMSITTDTSTETSIPGKYIFARILVTDLDASRQVLSMVQVCVNDPCWNKICSDPNQKCDPCTGLCTDLPCGNVSVGSPANTNNNNISVQ
jgi:hypothetical protein